MSKNILGNAIKFLRKQKRWTQLELSEKTGYKQSTISGHENKKSGLDEIDIKNYAQALGVKPEVLFTLSEKLNKGEQITDADLTWISDSNVHGEKSTTTHQEQDLDEKQILIASHIDNDVTEEDMEEILNFIEYVKSKSK